MASRKKDILSSLLVLLLLLSCLIGSEVWYASRISPTGIRNVEDFLHRFGEPRRVREFQRNGARFYHLTGELPPAYVLALPSSAPVYVFDERGRFVEWRSDPGDLGDSALWWRRWPVKEGQELPKVEFLQRYHR